MKEIKWLFLIVVALVGVGFWLGHNTFPPKQVKLPGTEIKVPGDTPVTASSVKLPYYIPPESKIDLTPLYNEIATLRAEKDSLFRWGLEAWNRDTTQPPPPVIVNRPVPEPKSSLAGFGLWPGIIASLNYKDKITPSGYLTLQYFYLHRFTFGCQVNTKEAGLNIGYHVPIFRNLQVKLLANKQFNGTSWPDNVGVGFGLNF